MQGLIAWIAAQAPALPPADNRPVKTPSLISARDTVDRAVGGNFHVTGEILLTTAIFLFAMLALAILYLLVSRERATPYVLRIYVITILIVGSLLVVSSAYTADQLAPVMGLFGTIAGYLLGRGDRRDGND